MTKTRVRVAAVSLPLITAAACGKPFWKAPPPPPEPVFPARLMNAEIDSIALTQTECLDVACPAYRYLLRRDGTAEYQGYDAAPIIGRYSAPLERARFDSLVRVLRRKHFLRLARGYEYAATHQTSKITQAYLADTVKEVNRYGYPADAPAELYQVEEAIEGVGRSLHWRYIGPSTRDIQEE